MQHLCLAASRLRIPHDASKIALASMTNQADQRWERKRPPAVVNVFESQRLAPHKGVIITGDDFGLSPEINAGIIRAHREGVLTGASLMVAAPGRDEAADLARQNPALDVGLHLVVCRGMSVTPARKLEGIVGADGRFPQNPVFAGMSYFFSRRVHGLLRDELRAQIELHLKLVGSLNHVDGHLNFHVHPIIAAMLVDLAVEYGIKCIRLPKERLFDTLRLSRDHVPRKLLENLIFRTLSRRMRTLMNARGIFTSDWLFGLHQSGRMTEQYVLGVVQKLRPGLTEIYFHPAADMGATPPSIEAQHEVRVLTSARMREALQTSGARLTSFAALARR